MKAFFSGQRENELTFAMISHNLGQAREKMAIFSSRIAVISSTDRRFSRHSRTCLRCAHLVGHAARVPSVRTLMWITHNAGPLAGHAGRVPYGRDITK